MCSLTPKLQQKSILTEHYLIFFRSPPSLKKWGKMNICEFNCQSNSSEFIDRVNIVQRPDRVNFKL